MFDESVIGLLLYLHNNGGIAENLRIIRGDLSYSISKVNRARLILKRYGLIKEEVVKGAPVLLRITISDKGRLVIKHVIEILKLLEDIE